MMIENLQFPDAAQMLARKYNVIIPEPERRHYTREDKEAGVAAYNLRERVFLLHEKLAAWYRANLVNGNAAKAAEYFKTRRLDPVFAEKFMIGGRPGSLGRHDSVGDTGRVHDRRDEGGATCIRE